MRFSDDNQLKVLKENYGKKDSDCVKRVKAIYNELKLKDVFLQEEDQQYRDICKLIDDLKNKSQLNPKIFRQFLDKIYKSEK